MNSIDTSVDAVSFDRSMPSPPAIARAILDGFDNHYRRFRYAAQQAKALFENGDWQAIREARLARRIDFYARRCGRSN